MRNKQREIKKRYWRNKKYSTKDIAQKKNDNINSHNDDLLKLNMSPLIIQYEKKYDPINHAHKTFNIYIVLYSWNSLVYFLKIIWTSTKQWHSFNWKIVSVFKSSFSISSGRLQLPIHTWPKTSLCLRKFLQREIHGKVWKKVDRSLASQIKKTNSGNEWGDRCHTQIILRIVCHFLSSFLSAWLPYSNVLVFILYYYILF